MTHASIKTAVFPVAGLGTRFLPATKALPKEMLPIIDKPVIQYAVEEARAAGIENFIFVTSHDKSMIENHFDASHSLEQILQQQGKIDILRDMQTVQMQPGQAAFIHQQYPLGLGHAVWCAHQLVGKQPFAVILPDDVILAKTPCLGQMIATYHQKGGNIVAVMDVPREHTHRYGILDIAQAEGSVVKAKGVVEKPATMVAPSTTAIVGRYILQPEIFEILDHIPRGANGEIQLTDAFPALMTIMPFHGLRFEGQRFDCGTKAGWLEANIAMAYNRQDLQSSLLAAIKNHCQLPA